MVTIFTIPKAFSGHTGLIQRNAVQSWLQLGREVEVFLVGNDAGVGETARELGALHIEKVERNEYGTPLLQSAFDQAAERASNNVLCFVNADIILLGEFLAGVKQVKLKRYLMVGDRIDLDLDQPIDFSASFWNNDLRQLIATSGKEHGSLGSDYFVFRKDAKLTQLNGLAVGRPGWDNWFIYHARAIGVPVINASRSFKVIHQNHDYAHVPRHSGGTTNGKDWHGPETEKQKTLIGEIQNTFSPCDATHVLTDSGLQPAWSYEYLSQRWRRWPVLNPRVMWFFEIAERYTPGILKRVLRSLLPSQM